MREACVLIVLSIAVTAALAARQAPTWPIEPHAIGDWEFDGTGGWAMRGPVLVLEKAGVPAGPIRRPAGVAVVRSAPLRSFRMTVEMRSTAPVDLDVRDVLLIFGYQSPTRFYYVHLAAKVDPVHNGIFLVNDADRKRLDQPTSTAHNTDQAWHRYRLERDAQRGDIRVFWDDLAAPVLTANDRTLLDGRVGVGSFDETGEYRNLRVDALR
jgi:hypothetical protein